VKIPAKIRLAIAAGERHIPGIFVMLRFVMARKNHFDLLFGPKDSRGEIEITREQVLEEAHKSMELFLMDYADIDNFWTGRLEVTPLNRDAVERALSAYRLFRNYKYAPEYEENLRAADAVLAQLRDAELAGTVLCETPDPVEVVSIRVTAGNKS